MKNLIINKNILDVLLSFVAKEPLREVMECVCLTIKENKASFSAVNRVSAVVYAHPQEVDFLPDGEYLLPKRGFDALKSLKGDLEFSLDEGEGEGESESESESERGVKNWRIKKITVSSSNFNIKIDLLRGLQFPRLTHLFAEPPLDKNDFSQTIPLIAQPSQDFVKNVNTAYALKRRFKPKEKPVTLPIYPHTYQAMLPKKNDETPLQNLLQLTEKPIHVRFDEWVFVSMPICALPYKGEVK